MNDDHTDPPEHVDTGWDKPSKSQIKRDMHALLDLGRALVALPAARLAQLPLEEKLHDAILLAQRITSHEGRRRQIHLVGKLMRSADAGAIRTQLELWASGQQAANAAHHQIEALREQLLASDGALTSLLAEHPNLDIQALRAQIRAARKEASENAARPAGQEPARKHYRALFQTLKSIIGE